MWAKLQRTTAAKRQPSASSSSSSVVPQRRPSPLVINEVLSRILSFLNQDTLKSTAIRVSRLWFLIATGLIERHLVLGHNSQKSWKEFRNRVLMADKLTIGRTIGPWYQTMGEEEAVKWNSMVAFAVWTLTEINNNTNSNDHKNSALAKTNSSCGHDDIKGGTRCLRFKTLSLNVEHWWTKQDQILVPFNSSSLTELNLDVPFETGPIQLSSLLDQLPNLLRLSLSTRKWNRSWRINDETRQACIQFPRENNGVIENNNDYGSNLAEQPHPLRLLRFSSLRISPTALRSFLPRFPQLRELYLLDVRNTTAITSELQDTLNEEGPRKKLWLSLSVHCPKLGTIHLNCQDHSQNNCGEIPVELFPEVYSIGLDGRPRAATMTTWKSLMVCNRVENRITSLELLGDDIYLRYQDRHELAHERDRTLFRFLSCSPCLLHLKTGRLCITWRALWDPAFYNEHDHETTMATMTPSLFWACRGLKTLSMRISVEDESYHGDRSLCACVLGYLSRICPRLQELELWIGSQIWELKYGLCLLTRLRNLRRLELGTDALDSYDKFAFQERDFVWMKKSPLSMKATTTTSSSSLSHSFLSRHFRTGSPHHRDDRENDYLHCIDRIQNSSSSGNAKTRSQEYNEEPLAAPRQGKSDRSMMHQKQERNQYRTDYDRFLTAPIVDGLEDLAYSGSNLDIEACLRAQLFRIRQQRERDQQQQQQQQQQGRDVTEIGERVVQETEEPWDKLEQLVLKHSYHSDRNDKGLERHIEKICKSLRRIRPDIDIQCRFGTRGDIPF